MLPVDYNINTLATDFFILFAKFEYALKATGYLSNLTEGARAEANWDAYFSSSPIKNLIANPGADTDLKKSLDYIIQNPPNKQVIRNRKLSWEPILFQGQAIHLQLSIFIRCIRNNVFHGGKFTGGQWEDPERSAYLINASIVVLQHCLSVSPDQAYVLNNP